VIFIELSGRNRCTDYSSINRSKPDYIIFSLLPKSKPAIVVINTRRKKHCVKNSVENR